MTQESASRKVSELPVLTSNIDGTWRVDVSLEEVRSIIEQHKQSFMMAARGSSILVKPDRMAYVRAVKGFHLEVHDILEDFPVTKDTMHERWPSADGVIDYE
jgi:hypothetical protein